MSTQAFMASTTALRLTGRYDGPADLPGIMQLASVLARARVMVPRAYWGQPEAVVATVYAARALDIPVHTAMQELYEVEDSVKKKAVLIRALWLRHGVKYHCEVTDTEAVGWIQRPGEDERYEVTYTIQDAARLGLIDHNEEWNRQPQQMLFARWTTRIANRWTPNIILGMSIDETAADPAQLGDNWTTGEPIPDEVLAVLDDAGRAVADGKGTEGLQAVWKASEELHDLWAGGGESLRQVLARMLADAGRDEAEADAGDDGDERRDQDQEDDGPAGPERRVEPALLADGGSLECGCPLDAVVEAGGSHPKTCLLGA